MKSYNKHIYIYLLVGVIITLVLVIILEFYRIQLLTLNNDLEDNQLFKEQTTPTVRSNSQGDELGVTSTPFVTTISNKIPLLEVCSNPLVSDCFFPPKVEKTKTIILLWVSNLKEKEPPYISIDNIKFECGISDLKNNIVYCSGPKIDGQNLTFMLFAYDGQLISIGSITLTENTTLPIQKTKTPGVEDDEIVEPTNTSIYYPNPDK